MAALTTAGAVGFSLMQTPLYESTAEVLVQPIAIDVAPPGEAPNMETERKLASSVTLAELVVDDLALRDDAAEVAKAVSVDVPPETEILTFTYSHSEPAEAQRRAQAFAEAYLEYRSEQALEDVQAASTSIQAEIDRLSDQLGNLEAKIAAEESRGRKAQRPRSREERLRAQASALAGRIAVLQQEMAASVPAAEIGAGRIVEPAPLPEVPARPRHLVNASLGIVLGLMLGVGVAVTRDYLDDHLRGRADLESYSQAHVLAVIPHARPLKKSRDLGAVTVEQPDSAAAESFRQLRTNMLFAASRRDAKTILITSAQAGEGKTSTTANLGVSLARAGKKVILVSADLRKPRLHAFFNLSNRMGVTDVLSEGLPPLDALQRAGVENLRVLASGSLPGNAGELLGSDEMRRLLIELGRAAQFVLIDTAPLLPVADAAALVPYVDAVLFVADARRATRGAVVHAIEQLHQVNAAVIGSVLNNVDLSRAGYPTYLAQGYGYREVERTG